MFLNLIVDDPGRSAQFYRDVFGLVPRFESGWFVQLGHPDQPLLELGFLRAGHDVVKDVPGAAPAAGALLTIVVEDVAAVVEAAQARGGAVVQAPRDWFYGQRRALVRDPDGTVIDVSAEGAADPDWMARVEQAPEGHWVEREG